MFQSNRHDLFEHGQVLELLEGIWLMEEEWRLTGLDSSSIGLKEEQLTYELGHQKIVSRGFSFRIFLNKKNNFFQIDH